MITAHEFRTGLEKRLGYTMTETQWEQLKADIGQDKDGLIHYMKFLELFDITYVSLVVTTSKLDMFSKPFKNCQIDIYI